MFGLTLGSKAWKGFIDSELPMPMLIAQGEVNFTCPTQQKYGLSLGRIPTITLQKYSPEKLVIISTNPWDSSRRIMDLNPSLIFYAYTSTGDWAQVTYEADRHGEVFDYYEDDHTCTLNKHVYISLPPGQHGIRQGLLRILVFTVTPLENSLPSYGLVMRNSNNKVTFSTKKLPLMVKGLSVPPTYKAGDVLYNQNPKVVTISGVNNARKPAIPLGFAVGDNLISWGPSSGAVGAVYNDKKGGVCVVPAYGRGRNSYQAYSMYYSNGNGYSRLPVIETDDYF